MCVEYKFAHHFKCRKDIFILKHIRDFTLHKAINNVLVYMTVFGVC